MRKLKVTAEMRKRLSNVRDVKGNVRKGGVMRVPPILPPDEWEAIAAPSQDALIAASWEDRAQREPEAVVNGPDPANVSHRYRVRR